MSKFCINCINFVPASKGLEALAVIHGKCFLTASQKTNPVSGKIEQAYATNNRMSGAICGPDGTWFEQAGRESELRNEIAARGSC